MSTQAKHSPIESNNQEHLCRVSSDQLVDLRQSVLDAQKDITLIRRSGGGSLNNALSQHKTLQDINSLSLSTRIKLLESKPLVTWKLDEPITGDSQPSLCDICRTINFQWLLHNKTRVFEGPFLGTMKVVGERYNCSFCRLVIRFLKQAYGLETAEAITDHGYLECHLSGIQDLDGEFFVMLMHHDELKFRFGVRQLGESLGDARLVRPVLDFNLLRSWLSQSETYDLSTTWIQHSEGKIINISREMGSARIIQLESEFRLIDVKKRCVVRSTICSRYITLSYVWGGLPKIQLQRHNKNDLQVEGSLNMPNVVGQTAIDAMTVVERLGETYLWIDSLCIIQDDPKSKATQLVAMDEIYRSSIMTIAAISGQDSNATLPGVGGRNAIQIIETIGNVNFITGLNRFRLFFDRCKWNTRAWTYQEQLLSPRLLFMTPEQVFLKTKNLNFQEDTVGLTKQSQPYTTDMTVSENWKSCIRVPSQTSYTRHHNLPTFETVNFNAYSDVVENYKKRSLSFPKVDFWNAFSGIASELETLFRGPVLEGLPQTEIEEALLWYWDTDSVEMKDDDGTSLSPSYSWLGCTGQVRYHRTCLNVSCIEWFLEGPENNDFNLKHYPIEVFRQGSGNRTHLQWRHVFDDTGRYYYRVDRPDLYFLHPIDTEPERTVPIQSQTVRGNVLRFKAQTAQLYLSKKHSPIYRASNVVPTLRACKDGVHTICSLSVLDESGYLAGTVEVPASVSACLLEGKHEFLALSRPHENDSDIGPRLPESSGQTFPDGSTIGDSDPYLWPSEIFQNMSDEQPPEMESGTGIDKNLNLPFDNHRFDPDKFLPVYTVLLIVWDKLAGWDRLVARRVGIGNIHIDAFAQAKPEHKTIYLR